jgi:PAS domain S-box-containing protein
MDWKHKFAEAEKELNTLRAQNTHLRRQMIQSLKGDKGELQSQEKLMDFIRRVTRRIDDEELYQVITEEFLLELGANRVVILLQGGSEQKNLVATHQACQKSIPLVPLPYFVSLDPKDVYKKFLDDASESFTVSEANFDTSIEIHPLLTIKAAKTFPIEVAGEGIWLLCLQWMDTIPEWGILEYQLFEDMALHTNMIVEQRQLITQLRDLKDQQDSLIHSMPSAIIGMDFLGSITLWNSQAEAFFAIRETEALGKIFSDLVPDFSQVAKKVVDAISGGQETILEKVIYKTQSGGELVLQPHLFSLLDSNRGEIALRIDDVTLQDDLQSKLMHIQKMETVGALAGGMANDFNTIISGMTTTLNLIKSRWGNQVGHDQDVEDLGILSSCTEKARDLVSRLIFLSKNKEAKVEQIDLVHMVDHVYHLLKGTLSKKIQIRIENQWDKALIMGDFHKVENCILNLCLNAKDAMPAGGMIVLSLSPYIVTEPYASYFKVKEGDEFWLLEVKDTGEGISPSQQLDIFKAFYTTKLKTQGTGLGLAIVDQVMLAHDGHVDVKSNPGEGSSFRLYFPAQEKVPTSISKIKKALLIEVDDIEAKIYSRLLEELGFITTVCKSATEALSKVSEGLEFDLLVVSDFLVGMSFDRFLKMIFEIYKNQKVIVIGEKETNYANVVLLGHPPSLEGLRTCLKKLKFQYAE